MLLWCCVCVCSVLQFSAEVSDNVVPLMSYLKFTCHYLECLYDPSSVWRLSLDKFVSLSFLSFVILTTYVMSCCSQSIAVVLCSHHSTARLDLKHCARDNLILDICLSFYVFGTRTQEVVDSLGRKFQAHSVLGQQQYQLEFWHLSPWQWLPRGKDKGFH